MRTATWYSSFAKAASRFCGRLRTFALAVGVIPVCLVTGRLFSFSDTWQLVVNTGTTTSHILDGVFDSEHAKPRHGASQP
jgi:low affinity Fe/Cu permease